MYSNITVLSEELVGKSLKHVTKLHINYMYTHMTDVHFIDKNLIKNLIES